MFSDELWRALFNAPFSASVSLVDALVVVVLILVLMWRAFVHARAGGVDVPGSERILASTLFVVLTIVFIARMAAIIT